MFTLLLAAAAVTAVCLAYRRLPATSSLRSAATTVADLSGRFYPKGPTTIASLQRRVLRRMYQSVTVGVSGTVVVPSDFTVTLSAEDFAVVEPMRTWFVAELADALTAEAARSGWNCPARVHITLTSSYDQPAGMAAVAGFFNPITEAAPPPRPLIDGPTEFMGDHARLIADGAVWLITNGAVAGRATDVDISVCDPGASRHHCRFGHGPDGWYVEDLGSLNGTTVNGATVATPTRLADGDTVTLGSNFVATVALNSAANIHTR